MNLTVITIRGGSDIESSPPLLLLLAHVLLQPGAWGGGAESLSAPPPHASVGWMRQCSQESAKNRYRLIASLEDGIHVVGLRG